jgi:hypothetical protein
LRLLDDRGRVFGKFSIIDLFVVLLLVAGAVWFGYSMFGKNLKADVAERQHETEFTVVTSNIRPSTAEAIARGGKIFEFKTGACLGEVVSVTTEPAKVWLVEGDGKWVQTELQDRVDAYVTIKGTARVSENVITVSGVEIRVGGSLSLQTKLSAFQGHVMTMDLDLGSVTQ